MPQACPEAGPSLPGEGALPEWQGLIRTGPRAPWDGPFRGVWAEKP